jgi:hypothetical protein
MRRTIRACTSCGSRDLRWPSAADGGPVGQGTELARYVCDACGWQGVAMLFDDEAAWRAFVSALAGPPGNRP